MLPWTTRLAAWLSGLIIFLWLCFCTFQSGSWPDSNETTAVFEALAMSGAAILVAVNAASKKKTAQTKRPWHNFLETIFFESLRDDKAINDCAKLSNCHH